MFSEECKKENKDLFIILKSVLGLLSLFLLVLVISTAVDINEKARETENTITISEKGTVYVKPDLAITAASVVTEKTTVEAAMAENTAKMNAVIEAMKEEGIEEKDLKTAAFSIYPRYEWQEKTQFYPAGRRVLAGYEVRQSLEIKIRDMEKIGQIIERAAGAGANQLSDLQFTVDDQDKVKKEAREQAIEKAKSKAKELASQLGVSLIRISNFSEYGASPIYYGLERAVAEESAAPQIEVGENKIEVTVSITYDIK